MCSVFPCFAEKQKIFSKAFSFRGKFFYFVRGSQNLPIRRKHETALSDNARNGRDYTGREEWRGRLLHNRPMSLKMEKEGV